VAPFHGVVFGGMQKNIAEAAERLERTGLGPHEEGPELRTVAGGGVLPKLPAQLSMLLTRLNAARSR
jgi:hypothetical protein